MQTSQTFSFLFWINASRAKNNLAEIYVRVTINKKRINISLKRKVDINLSDKNKSHVKGRGQLARITNDYLYQIQVKLFSCQQELKNEGKVVTAKIIKSRFLGEDKKQYPLQDLITYHNESMVHKLQRYHEALQDYSKVFDVIRQ